MKKDAPGTVLGGKYELVRVAGQGGMARVWKARMVTPAGARTVAVKRMAVEADKNTDFCALFLEEARVGLQLQHPNIVQVLDFDANEDDGYFIVMEWVEGLDLLEYMRAFHGDGRHLPWQAVAAVGHGVCQGLVGAHERIDASGRIIPVIHRDLTPGNVMVGADGCVKITDFGLARAMDRGGMTRPNTIKGKLSYTAPELAEGQRASVRSDIFGLGVTLWEALAGCKLFSGKTNLEVIQAIYQWQILPLGPMRPDVPPALVALVERAIARDPSKRFSSAREMGGALFDVLRADPVDPQRLGASVIAASVRLAEMDCVADRNAEPTLILEPESDPSAEVATQPTIRAPAPHGPPIPGPPPDELPPAPNAISAPAPTRVPRPGRPSPGQARPLPVPNRVPTTAPTPVVRVAQAPHEQIQMSFSDLFEAGVGGNLNPETSPASHRMGGKHKSDLLEVLDHPSSWNLEVEPGRNG